MDAAELLRAWRRILPSTVRVCAGPFLESPPPLSTGERRSAGEVGAARLRELQNGRHYAKSALGALGVPAAELPVGRDRGPQWPDGIVGSITHATGEGGDYAAAAVARASEVAALGIDAEGGVGLDARDWDRVLSPDETARLLALPPPSRPAEVQALWCLKESALKAARRSLDPTDVEIRRGPGTADGVDVWIVRLGGATWEGRSARVCGWVLAAVTK
jgi:4'-phosphopantetheinyl transferase EntD